MKSCQGYHHHILVPYKILNQFYIINNSLEMLSLAKIDELTADLTKTGYSFNAMGLTDEEVDYLAKKDFICVTQLEIFYNRVTGSAINSLVRGRNLQLVRLNLGSNRIGDLGVRYLTKGHWPGLESLQLHSNQIGDEGVQHLLKGEWRSLKVLTIGFNKITDQSARNIPKGHWPHLACLSLWNDFTSHAIPALLLADWLEPTEIRAACKSKSYPVSSANIGHLRNRFPKVGEACLKEMGTGRRVQIY